MTNFLDEFKEYDDEHCPIPKGSIIGIYGKYYKLSIWYVYDHYNSNVTIIKLDDNHKLLENPVILMLSPEDINYYIIDWNAYYINISKDYISNYYKYTVPLFKVKYGDIINLSDYKNKYKLFYVMNFDPVSNTFLILKMSKTKKNKYTSINMGLCNYYIVSRKELRSNIINKSKEYTKNYIINCYESIDIIDEEIYIKNKINYLLEKSYCNNMNTYGFLNGNLETIKDDLDEYEDNINDDIWKDLFTKKIDLFNNDENYINTIVNNNDLNSNYDNSEIENIVLSKVNMPIIKIYSPYDNGEQYDDDLNNYLERYESNKDLIQFSYSSEEKEYYEQMRLNKSNRDNIINNYEKYDNNIYTEEDNNSYTGEDDNNSYQSESELSYCSDRYIYNNKFNADYSYEECNQCSDYTMSEVSNNYKYSSYDNSEPSNDDEYDSNTNKILETQIKYDHDYINALFENYYNSNIIDTSNEQINNLSALNSIQFYNDSVNKDEDENEEFSNMPQLIPIQDFIDNICKEYENEDNNCATLNKIVNNNTIIEIENINNNSDTIIEQSNEISNISEIDESNEEYVDINIIDVEPYEYKEERCSIM